MTTPRLTLLTDGPTDQALLPILVWLVNQHSTTAFEQNWANLERWPARPVKLAGRVSAAIDLFPCDILVVHRDAEREPSQNRIDEIKDATKQLTLPVVHIVPVRMTEAWLLFDESAIRRSAGCPNGTIPLDLPRLKLVESIPDPKSILREAILTASNLSGRRRKQLSPDIRRLADLVDDFSPLRELTSFKVFENSFRQALKSLGYLAQS